MKLSPIPTTGVIMVLFALASIAPGSAGTLTVDLAAFVSNGGRNHVHNRMFTLTNEQGRAVVQANAAEGEGLAWRDNIQFTTGVIECDLRGRNNPGASFVGLAFHGVDAETYEAIYFRPFNFGGTDPEHHKHAVQYICQPDFPWSLLREKHPGVFENSIAPDPEPDAWIHVHMVVEAKKVSVFANGAAQPCLVVNRLADRASGWVGLWVGNNSDGAFADLKITPDVRDKTP